MNKRWCDFCETETEHDNDGICLDCLVEVEEWDESTEDEDEEDEDK